MKCVLDAQRIGYSDSIIIFLEETWNIATGRLSSRHSELYSMWLLAIFSVPTSLLFMLFLIFVIL